MGSGEAHFSTLAWHFLEVVRKSARGQTRTDTRAAGTPVAVDGPGSTRLSSYVLMCIKNSSVAGRAVVGRAFNPGTC